LKRYIYKYYNKSKFTNNYLANDGKTLLMALERNDSYGGLDIYVSFLDKSGLWSKPLNLGPDVNTAADDFAPFVAADGVTMYYATDGFATYGKNDIFVTRQLEELWKKWSVPFNLGPVINTPGSDAYYTIPASGEYAYFVSDRNS